MMASANGYCKYKEVFLCFPPVITLSEHALMNLSAMQAIVVRCFMAPKEIID